MAKSFFCVKVRTHFYVVFSQQFHFRNLKNPKENSMITNYIYDKGSAMPINQDALTIEQVRIGRMQITMAMVCDGVGGLSQGEYASGLLTGKGREWFYGEAIDLCASHALPGKTDALLRRSFLRMLYAGTDQLKKYAAEQHIHLGTTMTCLLSWGRRYVLFHIGDSRAYQIGEQVRQLTRDDVTPDGTLTKCITDSGRYPCQMQRGRMRKTENFLICSDGFYRMLSERELLHSFPGKRFYSEKQLEKRLEALKNEIRRQGEKDNLSAIVLVGGGHYDLV